MEWMNVQFDQYGYVFLFIGLFAESLALPFPGELAMAVAGHIVYLGKSSLFLVMLYSFLGATIGTMITYMVGRMFGTPFFEKYGKYVFLNQQRIDKLTVWFAKYGNKILLVSYFVPGLRHFTGYVSGILKVRFSTFLLFSNLGAVVWVVLYVMAGRILGNQLEQALHLIGANSWTTAACIAAGVAIFIFIKYRLALRKKNAVLAATQNQSSE